MKPKISKELSNHRIEQAKEDTIAQIQTAEELINLAQEYIENQK